MFGLFSRSVILRNNATSRHKSFQSLLMSTQKVSAVKNSTTEETSKEKKNSKLLPPSSKLTLSQKRYILLAGKHKSVSDVPDVMADQQINQLYSRARIIVNLIFGVLVAIVCIMAVKGGKQAAKRGETIEKRNKDYHKQYLETHKDD